MSEPTETKTSEGDWRPSSVLSVGQDEQETSSRSSTSSANTPKEGDSTNASPFSPPPKQKTPLKAWIALIVAVIACSSGGVWFALLADCPAILRASWRLGLTAVLQVPGWIRDIRRANSELLTRYWKAIPLLTFAGAALAVHFAAWSISLNLTSLSHSLLFVCTTPILLVTFQGFGWLIFRKCCRKNRFANPPTWIEVVGTVVGFLSAALLAQEAANAASNSSSTVQKEPSLAGDLIATLGAAAMGVYLMSGASLRLWLPLWLYVFPVTFISCILAAIMSLVFEPQTTFFGVTNSSLFGLFGDARRFGLVFGAAFTSGILGHTLANFALEHISPLIVSVLLLNEPLIGSFIGYIVGVQTAPTLVTVLAGIPLMVAAGLVSLGSRDSVLFKKSQKYCQRRSKRFQVVDEPADVPALQTNVVVV